MKKVWGLSSFALTAMLLLTAPSSEATTVTYTTSGSHTWTAPAGVTSVIVELWGAGGGGSQDDGATYGGGGGGAYSKKVVAVTPGNNYTVVVGLGGFGDTGSATDGGDSYFINTSTVLAKGGSSGLSGLGGSASAGVGTTKYSGGNAQGGGGSSAGTAANGTNGSGDTGGIAPAGGGSGGDGDDSGNGYGQPGHAPGGGGGGDYQTPQNGGDGQAILTFTSGPPVTVPGAPTIGTATGGNSKATVTFTAPASDGNSVIIGYTVTSSPAGGVDSNAGTTGLSHLITGLTNGTPYTFSVTATNAVGTGAPSAASNSVTPTNLAPTVSLTSPANSGSVTLTDGVSATVAVGSKPQVMAVNPATNKIYVANATDITVIDGATNSTTTIAGVVHNPDSIAVNPITNKIYVANQSSYGTTLIDGATNTTTYVNMHNDSYIRGYAVAVNPVTDIAYVVGWNYSGDNGVVVSIDESQPRFIGQPTYNGGAIGNSFINDFQVVGVEPQTLAVNPVTNKVYVGNTDGTVTVLNGSTHATATPATYTTSLTVAATITIPGGVGHIAVNPATNKIYLGGTNTISVIDGDSNSIIATIAGAPTGGISDIAVNPVTNKIYVANYSYHTVTVIDGATNTATTVVLGSDDWPQAIAVNQTTNKIYVANNYSKTVAVIDGATNTVTATFSVGNGGLNSTFAVAVNPTTNNVYVSYDLTSSVTVISSGGNSLMLGANAADPDGSISKVEFYNGATLLGTDTTAPYNFNWASVTPGSYTLTAKAYDNSGAITTSSAATISATTPPGSPTMGTATGGDGQATVSFSPPASNGGSPITGYTVSSSPGFLPAYVATTGTSSPIVVTGLTNNTPYRFTVTATNAAGTGTMSLESSTVIPRSATAIPVVPDAPFINTVTADTPGTATVKFYPPASDGGSTITGYTVTAVGMPWQQTYAGPIVTPANVTATGTTSPIVVTGLTNGAPYQFIVAAINGVGTGAASAASNTVNARTVISGAPTNVVATPGTNGTATVTFSAPADNGGEPISSYIVISSPAGGLDSNHPPETSHTITGLANYTAYTFTVVAVNTAGASAPSAPSNSITPIAPATIPGAPNGVTATAGNAQASVNFSAPVSNGGSAITGYTVISSPAGGVDSNAGSTSLSHIITGLANGTAYTFTVSAQNGVGFSNPSTASNSVTPATTPNAPIIGTATAGNAKATVSFTAAFNGGSPITGYTVTSSPAGGVDSNAGSTALTHTITGLINGTAYTFTVKATSILGTSPASAASNSVIPSLLTAPGIPTIGTATRGNAQATVIFTAPASNGGSPITSYTVTSSPGNVTATGASSPIVVTGLTNGTAYTFTVVATNAIGSGNASVASNSVTPATTPGAPTSVTAAVGYGKATVTFTAPASNGGSPITGYTVISSPAGVVDSNAGSTSLSHIMTGLVNNGTTAYTFTVKATNAVGTGVASAASNSIISLNSVPYGVSITSPANFSVISLSAVNVPAGSSPNAVAVNPVTNKIYVPNYSSNNVTVIDGATNSTATVSAGVYPYAVAVNPVTNKIYVPNVGGGVTVIDGATNAATAIGAGSSPVAVAVNSVTNKIYVANAASNNVTVIDGATNSTTTVAVGTSPYSVAVNPVTNKIYVPNMGGGVTVIDGATNTTTTVPAGTSPYAVAVNPATNKIYVTNYSSANVTVIDGATNTTTTVPAGTSPYAVAVNSVTNKIYVANYSSINVTVIDGATNTTATVSVGSNPLSIAVNSATNKVYVPTYTNRSVVVIDGATNSTSTVPAGLNPVAVAVNPTTNIVYVANQGNSVTVIGGAAIPSIVINANALDQDGTISKVEFYNGATLLGTDTTAPYSFNWVGATTGTKTLTVKAYDNLNVSTTSAAFTITLTP